MKHYIYVSDAKLDMLSSQIPIPVLKRLGIEMKIDLKILSATIKTPVSDENRYQKLMVVERYLEQQDMIGTLEEPGGYFRGRMPMKYGIYHEASESGISYRGVREVLFFGGKQEQTILGLAGSAVHLISGGSGLGTVNVPAYESALPSSLISFLDKHLATEYTHNPRYPGGAIADLVDPTVQRRYEKVPVFSEDALNTVTLFEEFMTGPASRLDFLARVLVTGMSTEGSYRSILGSPIYVAHDDLPGDSTGG